VEEGVGIMAGLFLQKTGLKRAFIIHMGNRSKRNANLAVSNGTLGFESAPDLPAGEDEYHQL
jgi:hypothetical protein